MLEQGTEHPNGTLYTFGPFCLDTAERRLTKGGTPVSLTVKAFDLLAFLVANPGKLLSKGEILDRVWEGTDTYESSLTTHISMLRQALEETNAREYIQTVPKKGYRFIANVENGAAVPKISSHAAVSWNRIALGTIGLILIIVLGFLYWRRTRPRSPSAENLYGEAIQLERQGNDRLALITLNEALRIRPRFDEARVRAAWIYYDNNENDSALNYIHSVSDLSTNSQRQTSASESTLLQAEALGLLLQGTEDEAFIKLQRAAKSDPTDTDALYGVAEVAIDLGLYDQADQALRQCKAVDPKDPFCAFELVTLRVYQNRFEDAISEYQRARQSAADYPWLDEPAGFARLSQGDLNGALRHFHAVEDAGRRFASNIHFRASQEGIAAVALYQGKIQDARQQILAASETSNSSYEKATYSLRLASMDALHGRTADAKEEAQAAIDLSQSPDILVSAARAFAMAADHESALGALHRVASASGTLVKSYPAAEEFISGLAALSNSKLEDGITALKNAYRFEPSPETTYYLARAQMSASDWNDAAITLKELLNSSGKIVMDSDVSLIPMAEYSLAICYEHQGNSSKAKPLFASVKQQWEHADPELQSSVRQPSQP